MKRRHGNDRPCGTRFTESVGVRSIEAVPMFGTDDIGSDFHDMCRRRAGRFKHGQQIVQDSSSLFAERIAGSTLSFDRELTGNMNEASSPHCLAVVAQGFRGIICKNGFYSNHFLSQEAIACAKRRGVSAGRAVFCKVGNANFAYRWICQCRSELVQTA